MQHVYHYNTHSEQKYFLEHDLRKLYDLIGINGNIVSHASKGVASFLAAVNKPFYIDPQTHAFQQATIHLKRNIAEKGERPTYKFKSSIIELAQNRLKGPFSNVIERDQPLIIKDFKDDNGEFKADIIKEICERVIDFQIKTLVNSLESDEKEFLDDPSKNFRPAFVIAPYFYLSPNKYSEWLDISIRCYLQTRAIEKESEIYFALVISRPVLSEFSEDVIKKINEIKPAGILLWIDEHKEESLTENEIERYVNFLKSLSWPGTKIINAHGGYLSTLLAHPDIGLLSGIGHSVNYGESRSIVPIGGGIPMARFYLLPVHSRLRWADALYFATTNEWLKSPEDYHKNICSCKKCTELLKQFNNAITVFDKYGESKPVTFARRSGTMVSLEYPTSDAKQLAALHYLYNKKKEIDLNKEKNIKELVGEMEKFYSLYSERTGEELLEHLPRWTKVIKNIFPEKFK